jgi:acyl transferase domain-containing protein
MQDGRSSGLTAPNGPSQAKLIHAAILTTGVPQECVDLISIHGTGTPLGDPIEVGAIAQGLHFSKPKMDMDVRYLAMVSNKSCFGHTEGTAGAYSSPPPPPPRSLAILGLCYFGISSKIINTSYLDIFI